MTLVLRMKPDRRCHNCGAVGYVEEKLGLCCSCAGLWIKVKDRKNKLEATLRQKMAGYRA